MRGQVVVLAAVAVGVVLALDVVARAAAEGDPVAVVARVLVAVFCVGALLTVSRELHR